MCSVTILCAHDGKNIQSDVSQKLRLHRIHDRTVPLHASTSLEIDENSEILVIILTPQMCNDINSYVSSNTPSIVKSPSDSVILSACADSEKKRAVQVLSQHVDSFSDVDILDVQRRGGVNSAIANIVTKVESMDTNFKEEKPLVNKYILQPERITSLDQELVIVLLEGTLNIRTLTARIDADDIDLTAVKIKNDVWKIPTTDIPAGDRTIHIFADGDDLGPATLAKESNLDTLTSLLPHVVTAQPLELISRLLDIDTTDLDRELEDILCCHDHGDAGPYIPFRRLLEGLYRFGQMSGEGVWARDFPSPLHFFARHGLDAMCDWMLTKTPGAKKALSQRNDDNMTPVRLAAAHGFYSLAEHLEVEAQDDDNVFVVPNSPSRRELSPPPIPRPRDLSLSAGTPPGLGPFRPGKKTGKKTLSGGSAGSGLRSSEEYTGSSSESVGSRGSSEINRRQRGRLPSDATDNCMTTMLSVPPGTSPINSYLGDNATRGAPWQVPRRDRLYDEPTDMRSRSASDQFNTDTTSPINPYLGDNDTRGALWQVPRRVPVYDEPTDMRSRSASDQFNTEMGQEQPPETTAITGSRRKFLPRQRSLPEIEDKPLTLSKQSSIQRRNTDTRM